MRGRFEGTWWTESGVRPGPVLAVVAVAAVVSWLMTVILVIAVILAVVLLGAAAAVFYLRRANPDDAEALGRQAAGLHAEIAAERQAAAPKSLTIVNVQPGAHVHLPPGATVAGQIAPPVPGEVIREENPPWHSYRR